MERHEYEPCTHEGRHGYTLRGEDEHEMCERCRRGPEAHEHASPLGAPCAQPCKVCEVIYR